MPAPSVRTSLRLQRFTGLECHCILLCNLFAKHCLAPFACYLYAHSCSCCLNYGLSGVLVFNLCKCENEKMFRCGLAVYAVKRGMMFNRVCLCELIGWKAVALWIHWLKRFTFYPWLILVCILSACIYRIHWWFVMAMITHVSWSVILDVQITLWFTCVHVTYVTTHVVAGDHVIWFALQPPL